MALSRAGIASARSGAGEIQNLANSLKTAGEELKSTLTSNGNYQYFRMGTDKGTSVDTDINTAVDTVIDMLSPQISNVASAIESFCVRQEELNRLEELRKKEELEKNLSNVSGVVGAGVTAAKGVTAGPAASISRTI